MTLSSPIFRKLLLSAVLVIGLPLFALDFYLCCYSPVGGGYECFDALFASYKEFSVGPCTLPVLNVVYLPLTCFCGCG
jgi:hypothetical protein